MTTDWRRYLSLLLVAALGLLGGFALAGHESAKNVDPRLRRECVSILKTANMSDSYVRDCISARAGLK